MRNIIAFDLDDGTAILIDDEARHTDKWHWGDTINPTENDLVETLRNFLKSIDN